MIEKLLSRFPMITAMGCILFIYLYFDKDYKITEKIISFFKNKKGQVSYYRLFAFMISICFIGGFLPELNISSLALNALNGMLIGLGVSIVNRVAEYTKQ